MNAFAMFIMCIVIIVALVVTVDIALTLEMLFNIHRVNNYKKYNSGFSGIFRAAVNPYKEKKSKKRVFFYQIVAMMLWIVLSGVVVMLVFIMSPNILPVWAIAIILCSFLAFPVLMACIWGIPTVFFEAYILIASYRKKGFLRKISKIRKKYLDED